MTRLNALTVEGFRGIPAASLPFEGGSIVLGGGNGTGKTGFVDALEFLFTGSVSSLEGTSGLSVRQHAPHLLADARSARVTGAVVDPEAEVTRWLTGQLDAPGTVAAFLGEGKARTFILRRGQIQQFIHARPADRYRSMAELIGLEDLDRVEAALKRSRDTLLRALTDAEAALAGAEARLEGIPTEVSEASILAELRAGLNDLGVDSEPIDTWDSVNHVRADILRSVATPAPDARAAALLALAAQLERGVGAPELHDNLERYAALASNAARADDTGRLLDLLAILKRGRDYEQRHAEPHCPLCEQELDARRLVTRLTARVAELEEVSLRQQRLDRARDDLEAALRDTGGLAHSLARVQREAGDSTRATDSLSAAISMVLDSIRASAPIEALEMIVRLRAALDEWEQWRDERPASLAVTAPDVNNPDDDVTQRANSALGLLQNAAAQRLHAQRSAQERARLAQEIMPLRSAIPPRRRAFDLADLAFTTFNHVKTSQVQHVFDALQTDLVRFYDALHPGEGHSAVSIAMDPRRRGSSDLKIGFHGAEEADPRAYGSEGHLDSLGLCIFLASARRFNGNWPLLVLDDVVTSVDAAHKRRVARLLFEEFAGSQLFVTTHDSRWFLDLQKAEKETGFGPVGNYIIERWSLEEGPQIRLAEG